ncbi:MAG: acetolactate synthase large subunit [Candidatus Dadabacteria bacterium]|nr:acetolactate synthase large subunit [Candidatus Dadabacteria bacterium]
MKVSELLVKCLENEDVEYIFGIPGEENLDVMDALLDSKIKFILTRHEQGAAFMADVYGRLSQRAGVCLATLGPGATNLITGVADANMDRAPVVAITGQASLDRMHKESHQYIDIVRIFQSITKWNAQIKTPEITTEVLRKAFKVAQTEKPGATHIDLPEDVAGMEVEGEPLLAQFPYKPEPLAAQVERASKIISEAKYPIILAGNGVIREGSSEALRDFAKKLNIPVAETFMGKGVMRDDDELSLKTVGLQTRDYVSCGFDQADVVITVGYDLVEYSPSRWNPDRDKKIVHIDMSPAEVDANYVVAVGVLGDIAISLEEISAKAKPSDASYTRYLHDFIVKEFEDYGEDDSFPLKPQKILYDLRTTMGEDDIVISDVGAHKIWVARVFPCYRPNTCIISNGFATMGIGLPGAIGAKLLHPDRKVVTVTGDGGFLMNSQELETAVRYDIPVVCLIFSDKTYSLIELKQMQEFGRTSHVNFDNPDLVKYAESFGAVGMRVEASDELEPALLEAFSTRKPVVIDCPVDYSENKRLMDKLGKLICPV